MDFFFVFWKFCTETRWAHTFLGSSIQSLKSRYIGDIRGHFVNFFACGDIANKLCREMPLTYCPISVQNFSMSDELSKAENLHTQKKLITFVIAEIGTNFYRHGARHMLHRTWRTI